MTSVSGGVWFVVHDLLTQTNQWGIDIVGITPSWVDWYMQQSIPPCTIAFPQDLYMDSSTLGPQKFRTNLLIYKIDNSATDNIQYLQCAKAGTDSRQYAR